MIYPATRLIAAELEQNGIKYRVEDGDSCSTVTVKYNCNNISNILVEFISTNDGNAVAVRLFGLVRTPEEKRNAVLNQLNALNNNYRFVAFCLDSHNDVNMTYDFAANTSSDCLGASCFEMLQRFVNIADEAYPEIMKALWS